MRVHVLSRATDQAEREKREGDVAESGERFYQGGFQSVGGVVFAVFPCI